MTTFTSSHFNPHPLPLPVNGGLFTPFPRTRGKGVSFFEIHSSHGLFLTISLWSCYDHPSK